MDFVYGGEGDDIIDGKGGVNVLFGENGNDKLYDGEDGSYLNGGDGDDYAQKGCTEAFSLLEHTFTREGYTFSGWNTKADGSGTSYADQEEVTLSGDTVLYAQWKKEAAAEYTIRWLNEDGTLLYEETVSEGEMPAYQGSTPEKAADADHEYVFSGWDPEVVKATQDAVYGTIELIAGKKKAIRLQEDLTELAEGGHDILE